MSQDTPEKTTQGPAASASDLSPQANRTPASSNTGTWPAPSRKTGPRLLKIKELNRVGLRCVLRPLPSLCYSAWKESLGAQGRRQGCRPSRQVPWVVEGVRHSIGNPIHGPCWRRFQAQRIMVPRGLGGGRASPGPHPSALLGPPACTSPRPVRPTPRAAQNMPQNMGGLMAGNSMRAAWKPYLHQEAEGPASLVLQDSELHTGCKESKVPVREGGPPGLPGPRRPPPPALLLRAALGGLQAARAAARLSSPSFPSASLSCSLALVRASCRTALRDQSRGSGRRGKAGRLCCFLSRTGVFPEWTRHLLGGGHPAGISVPSNCCVHG